MMIPFCRFMFHDPYNTEVDTLFPPSLKYIYIYFKYKRKNLFSKDLHMYYFIIGTNGSP